MFTHILAFLTLAAIVMSAACAGTDERQQSVQGAPSPDVSTRQTEQAMPVVTEVVSDPSPTNSPIPTATAIATRPPTITPSPVPTATREPTATVIPSPTATFVPVGPAVIIGGETFRAEVADTPALRSKGLGERASLPEQSGMLFVFEGGQTSSFWMKGMQFPLDFVWIGEDCTVVDLTEDVQHSSPDTPSSELDIFESASPAAYTFEINAGDVSRLGIAIGDEVLFDNIQSEHAGCCESGACDGE